MSRFGSTCIAILAVTLVIRMLSLCAYPLADTTEARYSEIARLMLESGDWITLQVQAGEAFWGKPPLSTWLTAISFRIFGVSEFSARLPAFVLMLASAVLLLRFAAVTVDRDSGWVAACILLTSALGFVAAGAVMTDAALLFSTTLAMVSFWRATVSRQVRWGYLFFAALGLGLLAKGPIAWVLSLVPIGLWLAWSRRWSSHLALLPWRGGLALTVLIAVPWYAAAELRTPGFLEYFLIGEHWLRFVDSGWSGDRYGSAHAEVRGTIWLFWIVAASPWSLVGVYSFVKWRRSGVSMSLSDWHRYLFLWSVTPMLFFTFAGNILPAYVLPGLPAFALLLGRTIAARQSALLHAAWLMPLFLLLAGPVIIFERLAERSQQLLIRDVGERVAAGQLMYVFNRPHSANFYSSGAAQLATRVVHIGAHLDRPGRQFVAVRIERRAELPESIQQRLAVTHQYKRFVLMREVSAQ